MAPKPRTQTLLSNGPLETGPDKPARSAAANKFLSQIRAQIAGGLRRRNDGDLRTVFDSYAVVDGATKHIPTKMVKDALEALHVVISDYEVENFVESANLNDDAYLDFDEFKQAVQSSTRLLQWTKSLPFAEILADALPKSSGADPLREISHLTHQDIELVAEGVLEEMKAVLKEHVGKLKKAFEVLDSKQDSGNAAQGSKFGIEKMNCGKIGDFHSGLQKRIGYCHLEFENAMYAEHCTKNGCEVTFTTTNHEIVTCPKKEWEHVLSPSEVPPEDAKGGRRIPDINVLVKSELTKNADLKRAEVIAIVLYTGPMFQVYNTILRRHPEADYKAFEVTNNMFSTTIFVLVSAVQKISRAMKLPAGLHLYRGLGGTKDLPESFFKSDKNGCKGFVDWGFMSTTADKKIAIRYSGVEDKKPLPIVLEITFGAVDRGACIRDFSQYPAEVEYLYVPCSFLEQNGPERVELADEGIVRIFPVKVNANLKTVTIEELLGQKKSMHISAFNYAIDEIDKELHAMAAEKKAEARLEADTTRDPSHSVEGFLGRIVQQCREVVSRHEAVPAQQYTVDGIFRSLVLEMVDVKLMATSKLEEWLENKEGSFIRYRLDAPLRTAHRRWICYLHRQLLQPSADMETSAAFLKLCKVKGLVVESVEELNELKENRLMAVAAEGRSRRDVKLLVEAKAAVNAARPDGVTPMWLAAQFGHVCVVEELEALKADVNQCANNLASPLYIASQSGNLHCMETLIRLKADVNKSDDRGLSPLHQAAMNGHDRCIQLLIDNRADVDQADKAGKTPLKHLRKDDVNCRKLLSPNAKKQLIRDVSDERMAEPTKNKLIISTGDISDVDGFVALAEYAKTGADVLFIMNYPAYIGVPAGHADHSYQETHPGLGYKYTASEVLDKVKVPPEEYSRILSSYPEQDANVVVKRALTDLAFWVANKVWEDVEPTSPDARGSLLFCIGGINEINPFSAAVIKNEILSHSKLKPVIARLSPTEGAVYGSKGEQCEVKLSEYAEIYIDFNGSMAFWSESWNARLSEVKDRIKGAFIMGGVWAHTAPVTLPSIPNVLNRFSSATMNQLYHPEHAADFFAFLAQSKVPTFTVTNNIVGEFVTYKEDGKTKTDLGIVQFLSSNNFRGAFLETLLLEHYNSQPTAQRKPYDFYCALALTTLAGDHDVNRGKKKKLFYSNVYGITFVSPFDSWEKTREEYSSAVDTSENEHDNDFIKNKKAYFRQEIAIMNAIQRLECLPVRDLKFRMDAAKEFKVEMVSWDETADQPSA